MPYVCSWSRTKCSSGWISKDAGIDLGSSVVLIDRENVPTRFQFAFGAILPTKLPAGLIDRFVNNCGGEDDADALNESGRGREALNEAERLEFERWLYLNRSGDVESGWWAESDPSRYLLL